MPELFRARSKERRQKMKKMYSEEKLSDFRELINRSAERYSSKTAFYLKSGKGERTVTYSMLKKAFYSLCSAFISMGLKGKRIAVIGKNSYEWSLCYLAAATVGVVVPLDKELDPTDVKNFVEISESKAICIDDSLLSEAYGDINLIPFSSLDELTEKTVADTEAVDAIEISKDEMQILLFTSGTTGFAKGVCLSQNNILTNIYSTVRVVKVKSSDRTMSILPIHHTYECTLDCLLILSRGACITYAESLVKIQKNILEYNPTVLVVVPLLMKTLHKRILSKVIGGMPEKYKPYFERNKFSVALGKLPFIVRAVVRRKVKAALGGKLRLFIVGAADIDTDIIEDFIALGIRTLQGYGLTECSPLLAGNSDFFFNAKSTGRAIPDVEIKIDSPNAEGVGEIIARGENIMLGYFGDPEGTRKVLTEDGWFSTGDLGYLDSDGALYITGRKKNIIVAENGKNIYPEELEARIAAFSEVEEVIIIPCFEKGRTEIKAKIYPCIEYLSSKLGHIPTPDEVKARIEEIIAEINNINPEYKRIRFLEILTQTLEKTTTRKVKRFGANLA